MFALEATIDLRQSDLSVSWRIFLTMYRCTLIRKELVLKVLSQFIIKAGLDTSRNVFNSLSEFMLYHNRLKHAKTFLWKHI